MALSLTTSYWISQWVNVALKLELFWYLSLGSGGNERIRMSQTSYFPSIESYNQRLALSRLATPFLRFNWHPSTVSTSSFCWCGICWMSCSWMHGKGSFPVLWTWHHLCKWQPLSRCWSWCVLFTTLWPCLFETLLYPCLLVINSRIYLVLINFKVLYGFRSNSWSRRESLPIHS